MSETFLRNSLKEIRDMLDELTVPRVLRENFRHLSAEHEAQLSQCILDSYLKSSSYAETEVGRNDLADHLYRRLRQDRHHNPMAEHFAPVEGSHHS